MQSFKALLLILGVISLHSAQLVSGQGEMFFCYICGEGFEVTLPDNVVSVPTQPDRTCQDLLDANQQGMIAEANCALLIPFVFQTCGCQPAGGGEIGGSIVPTMAPMDGSSSGAPVSSSPPGDSSMAPTAGDGMAATSSPTASAVTTSPPTAGSSAAPSAAGTEGSTTEGPTASASEPADGSTVLSTSFILLGASLQALVAVWMML